MSEFHEWVTNNVAVPPGSLKVGSEIFSSLTLQHRTLSHNFFPEWIFFLMNAPSFNAAIFVNITSIHTNESS